MWADEIWWRVRTPCESSEIQAPICRRRGGDLDTGIGACCGRSGERELVRIAIRPASTFTSPPFYCRVISARRRACLSPPGSPLPAVPPTQRMILPCPLRFDRRRTHTAAERHSLSLGANRERNSPPNLCDPPHVTYKRCLPVHSHPSQLSASLI